MKKLLKKIGLWIGLFVLGLILISFLLPSDVKVRRTVIVNAPMDRVFSQVNNLFHWEMWSPWKRMDPAMVMSFSNPSEGQGAFYKWESNNSRLGKGTMTLSRVVQNEEIVTALESEDWGKASARFTFAHKGEGIEVAWSMENKVGWLPWNKYFGLMMRGELKKQFDQGLKDLKFQAEKS